jgi:hypothetical protein
MKRRTAWSVLAAVLLAACEGSGGVAGPAINQSAVAFAEGTWDVRSVLTGVERPLPALLDPHTAPTRCEAGDRTEFYGHFGQMVITRDGFRFTMRVSEDCWSYTRLEFYSPSPVFFTVVHEGRVVPAGGVILTGGGQPQDRYLRFIDANGTEVFGGRVTGDSLVFAAAVGYDEFVAIRQP